MFVVIQWRLYVKEKLTFSIVNTVLPYIGDAVTFSKSKQNQSDPLDKLKFDIIYMRKDIFHRTFFSKINIEVMQEENRKYIAQ